MSLLTWNSKQSVGVKAIDEQHGAFIEILNELHAAMMRGQAQHVAGRLLQKLKSHLTEHTSLEERLMESVKFPGLARHREHHRGMYLKIEEFIARHEKGDRSMYLPLLYFLRDCLSYHIMQQDREYISYMSEKGIS